MQMPPPQSSKVSEISTLLPVLLVTRHLVARRRHTSRASPAALLLVFGALPSTPATVCFHKDSTKPKWLRVENLSCHFSIIGIQNYCISTPPTLANANAPTPSTALGDNTTFTCNNGYLSSAAPLLPYYTCLANLQTSGSWSSVTYTCDRKFIYSTCKNWHTYIL